MSSKKKLVLALKPSYLAAIENSIGSGIFRNLFYKVNGKTIDVLEDGRLSCAVFVSSLLFLFGLISGRHATVASTLEDMQRAGWRRMKRPRRGAIILWDFEKYSDGTRGKNRHLGFYLDSETAVSNSSSRGRITQHHPTFGTLKNGAPRRAVLGYYWNQKLETR